MNNETFFDKLINRMTEKSNKSKVYAISVVSIALIILFSLALLYGFFYKIDLKLEAHGQLYLDESNDKLYALIFVNTDHYEKIKLGQEIEIVYPEFSTPFFIKEINSPLKGMDTFNILAEPKVQTREIRHDEKINVKIVYETRRIIDLLFKT
ncbi:hypothetical protein KKA47_06740 [bacterium]|nr:hypothetical protein [bacterium]